MEMGTTPVTIRKVVIKNKLDQGLPILLTNAKGQLQSWILPARGKREIFESELSQPLHDLENRKYVELTYLP